MNKIPLAALLVLCGARAGAALLINEDFSSYSSGNISGQAATTQNLTGNWTAASDNFGDFESQNGALQFTRNSSAGGSGTPKFAGALVDNNLSTTTNHTEFWSTGIVSTGTLRGAFFSVRLFDVDGGGAEGSPFVNRLVFGVDSGMAFIATNVSDFSNTSTSLSFTNRTDSTTTYDSSAHRLVVQLVNIDATNDAFRLWVDPDMSNGTAGLGTPTVEVVAGNMIYAAGSHLYDGVTTSPNQLRANALTNVSSDAQTGSLDEFKLGTAFDDLLIPEPSTALTVLLGFGLASIRRRR